MTLRVLTIRPAGIKAGAAAGLMTALLFGGSGARAGVYQALCSGGQNCTVTIANGALSLPGQNIPRERILSWSQGGSGSKTDVGLGVATTVLFGIPGLLGFGAKTHDYTFTITHVDGSGNLQNATVGFRNNVPANQFMMEMMGMSGLTLGQVNPELQEQLETLRSEATEKARLASLDCARVLKLYRCSWSAYLDGNPSVKTWAENNPQLVAAERARLGAVE
jgi:hypothetical protein